MGIFHLEDPKKLFIWMIQMKWRKPFYRITEWFGFGKDLKAHLQTLCFPRQKKHPRKATLGQPNIPFDPKATDLWRLSQLIFIYSLGPALFPSIKSKEAFQVRSSNIFQNETLSVFFLLNFWLETSIFHQMD